METVKDNKLNRYCIIPAMMKILLLSFALTLTSIDLFSQKANDFLVGGAFDLIKTDNEGFRSESTGWWRVQLFHHTKVAATGGLDIWADNVMSAVVGARWYPR